MNDQIIIDYGLGKLDAESKKKVEKALRDVFNKFDVLSLDRDKTRALEAELQQVAKAFGTALTTTIRNSINNDIIKTIKMDNLGNKTYKDVKGISNWGSIGAPYREGRASVSGERGPNIGWDAMEFFRVLGKPLQGFGYTAEESIEILRNLNKELSYLATDMKTNAFTLEFNAKDGTRLQVGGKSSFDKETGVISLSNPKLSSTMSSASDLSASAAKEYEHNLRLIKQYERRKDKEKEVAELKERNLELEKQLTKTLVKKFDYIKKETEAVKETKKQKEQEKEEEKKQNEAYKEALRLLTKIHQLKLDYIQNSDKANSAELLKINEEQVSILTEQLNAKKQLTSEEGRELLNAKEKVLTEERSLAIKRKELKLDSHRNARGNFLDETKTAVQRVVTYGAAYTLINILKQTINKSISTIIKFDKHMTNLRMVLQKTNKDTKNLKNTQQAAKKEVESLTKSYIELARELGSTSEAVINAADLWLRQGRSLAETNELIRATMIMSNIAAIDSAQSADILTSAINGFKLEAKDAMRVVDVFASVDLAAAANTEELAEAMQRVAATAGEVGVSFENITAYIGTLVDATRIAPETIGSALNTILSRMQNIKLGAMVSDEGDSLSDVQKALQQVDISLFDTNGSFKEMDVVLGELASKWKGLNDVEKSSIAYAVAGTRQRNVFLQLMNNWEKSVYLSAVALNSEGTALQKQEVYMDSYEASVNRLNDSWDKFLNTTNANSIKGLNNFLSSILELSNSLNFSFKDLLETLTGILLLLKSDTLASKFSDLLGRSKGKNTEKFVSALSKLTFKDEVVRSAASTVAQMGQSFKKFKPIKQIGSDVEGIFAASKLTEEQAQRVKKYQEMGLSAEQVLDTESALGTATRSSRGARLLKGIGTGLVVGQLISSLSKPIIDAISKIGDATNRVTLGKQSIEELGEKIKEKSAAETKSNLDMLTKIATQVTSGGISPELQSELSTIVETLNKNLGVSKSLLKVDENGNETLRSLEELVSEYEGEFINQSFETFMNGRETLFEDLNKQLTDKNYKAFGKIYDASAIASGILGGAAAGAMAGASVGGAFAWLTGLIGGVIGAIAGGATANQYTAGGVGEAVTIEEAIETTQKNYDQAIKEGNADIASQLKDNLDQLKEIKSAIDEQTEALREDYSANLQMLANATAKTQSKEVAPTDIAMIQSIVDVVAGELSLEQMASEDVYNIFRKGIGELISDLAGADTKAAYTEIYKTFESGGYFASLLGDNTTALQQVGAIISANGPTLASAASALREELEKNNKEYQRQLTAAEHRSNMLNSLATLGADSDFSKEQILSMLNIGGAVDTSGIIDPSLRAYAQGLANLYEEYWGEDGKIASASYLEDQEKLGEEYERAISLKQKEYEILKKQLEVQKAQNKLSEAKRERDTLVFRNGRFMYESNPNTIQQLLEEQEKLKKEQEQLEIQKDIQEYTKTEVDRLSEISTAVTKIQELLEGDVSANALKIQETIGKDIQKDIEDGIIDNPMYYLLYQYISGLSADYQDKLSQLKLFTDEEGNFITGLTGKSPFDKGGLLQGKGLFSKQTSLDEVVLSATDAPKILSLLSKTGEFQDTVLQANTLLKSLSIKDGKISSLLTQANGGNIIYNINAVNVEEANDIEGILYSASEKVKTTNSKFIKG